MLSVFLNPPPSPHIPPTGGIDRVVEALSERLANEGIQIAASPDNADVIANNATLIEERRGVPMVNHNHGLYWAEYQWASWTEEANRRIVEVMKRANAITAPSHWVSEAISRGMLVRPQVIYHGVDTDEWQPPSGDKRNLGYVLWNKAREDAVSNPRDMQEIAQRMTKLPFISTFGIPTSNVRVVGALSRSDMRSLVGGASLYLATARETFGIGTIEALSCGVPVVGWDYGGQKEIILPGKTGYLAPYGDYAALEECIRTALDEHHALSQNARADALSRWTWADKVKAYADLYKAVHASYHQPRPRVSVVVTTHNLARYLSDCLTSLREQTMEDWEAIVVDDWSDDNPKGIVDSMGDARFHYFRTRENMGLALSRNIGAARATGKYIIFLDADDMLDRAALEVLADALDFDTGIAIAYGRLDTISENGGARNLNPWPAGSFDWRAQMSHLNQLPYAALMRREVLEQSGGYRERDWRAEDASLWCRVTSLGFHAKAVTDRACLIYRLRSDSKSGNERREHRDGDGDWTKWFPWRTGAKNGQEGEEVFYHNIRPRTRLVPFASQGLPPPTRLSWAVPHYQDPCVSIIIPVSKEHRRYLIDALDSVVGQTITSWEAIVVDDSADTSMPDVLTTHPFARVIHAGGKGTGHARNLGIGAARGQFILFLDADDMIEPPTLEEMLKVYVDRGGYVYSDCKTPNDVKRLDGPAEIFQAAEYDQETFISSGYSSESPGRHSVTAMVAKADLLETPLFDETLAFWEDWAIYLELAVAGVQGTRISEPLLIYRLHTGTRRRASYDQEGALREALRARYEPYAKGEKQMCACGGGKGGTTARDSAIQALGVIHPEQSADPANIQTFTRNGTVRLRYVGDKFGAIPFRGEVTKKVYRAGKEPASEFVEIDPRDAPQLIRTGDFELVDVGWIEEKLAWAN